MSLATHLDTFDSPPDALLIRMALAIFGLRMLETKFRQGEARNFRQLVKLPVLASFTSDQIPKPAVFALCKAVQSICLSEIIDVVAQKGRLWLTQPIRTLSKPFPNVKSFEIEPCSWGDLIDMLSLSSWPNLERLIAPGESISMEKDYMGGGEAPSAAAWNCLACLQNLTELNVPVFNDAVQRLTNLVKLTLHVKEAVVPLDTFSTLTKLEMLEIDTRYTLYWVGPWQGSKFDSLGALTNMRQLLLPGLAIQGPDPQFQMTEAFNRMSRLEKVDFNKWFYLKQLPADLFWASAETLSSVLISGCPSLINIDALVHLPRLSSLDLVDTPCSDEIVSAIARMSQLETLAVNELKSGYGAFEKIAESLAPFGKLRELKFEPNGYAGVQDINESQLVCVSALTSLEKLYIHSVFVTSEGFRPLTTLQKLKLISMYCPKLRKAQVQAIFPGVEVVH
eukprot:TRINITY_DN10086_c0_g1_i1.p1 TRINITY_DN10086_c0_g1~~TRINITY_DN10086_c0_g1_i1.p1  ORF type:complete len:451 (-),score=39.08 TRINITY_DN10086_c0_g1_i1:922-2274(-)